MGGLTLIWSSRLQVVGGPDRDVELFIPVAIEVTEDEIERAVGIFLPTVKGRSNVLAAPEGCLTPGPLHGDESDTDHDDGHYRYVHERSRANLHRLRLLRSDRLTRRFRPLTAAVGQCSGARAVSPPARPPPP